MTSALPDIFQDRISDWPQPVQTCFAKIRACILDAATGTRAAPLVETLKWGEPSWLPAKPRIGSTLRVSWSDARPGNIGLYVNCQSTLAEDIRTIYPQTFDYEKHRVLWLPLDAPFPAEAVRHVASMVLLYHLHKR